MADMKEQLATAQAELAELNANADAVKLELINATGIRDQLTAEAEALRAEVQELQAQQ